MKTIKSLSILFLLFIQPVFAQLEPSNTNIFTSKLKEAIRNDNYSYLEEFFTKNPNLINERFDGKSLIIHSAILNKPEMIRLFFTLGVDINTRCEEGYSPEEHAMYNNSINALAEIIVIKA